MGAPRRTERHHLEVAAVLTTGLEAQALELARDVLGAFVIPGFADAAAQHRVVGELIEANLEIARGDVEDGGFGA